MEYVKTAGNVVVVVNPRKELIHHKDVVVVNKRSVTTCASRTCSHATHDSGYDEYTLAGIREEDLHVCNGSIYGFGDVGLLSCHDKRKEREERQEGLEQPEPVTGKQIRLMSRIDGISYAEARKREQDWAQDSFQYKLKKRNNLERRLTDRKKDLLGKAMSRGKAWISYKLSSGYREGVNLLPEMRQKCPGKWTWVRKGIPLKMLTNPSLEVYHDGGYFQSHWFVTYEPKSH